MYLTNVTSINDIKQQENINLEGFDHGKSSNILLGQSKVDRLEDPMKNSMG